jgi:DNA polymerase III gamma/tau subunit
MAESIANADEVRCLTMIQNALVEGKEVKQLLTDLLSYFRNLMLLQLGQGADELVVVPQETLQKLKKQCHDFNKEDLVQAIKILAAAENEIKWSSQGQVLLEITLLRIIEEIGINKGLAQPLQPSQKQIKAKPKKPLAQAKLEPADQGSAINIQVIEKKWDEILEVVRKTKIMCYAFFVEAQPISFQDGVLVLQYKVDHKFHCERSELPENKKVMEQAIEKVIGEQIAVECVLNEDPKKKELELTPEDDLVEKAIALFGGEVIEIED